jgi:hypothetical protein
MKTPKLDPKIAERVLTADLSNILAKVKAGRTLTRYERESVDAACKGQTAAPDDDGPNYVKNYSELAKVFEVSRQRVAYWAKKPGAPTPANDGRHNVAEWRRFLAAFASAPVMTGSTVSLQPSREALFLDGIMTAWEILDSLDKHLAAAAVAAGVELTAEQRDALTVQLWMLIAVRIDAITVREKLPGSCFDNVPPAIAAAAQRLGLKIEIPGKG